MPNARLQDKLQRLRRILLDMQSVIVAYSGGIDSTVVLKVAHEQLQDRAVGITAMSPTLPAIELDTARQVAAEIGARHEVVETNQLKISEFTKNDAARCFHCKTDLYQLLDALRQTRGTTHIVDGTNLDDLGDDRPGIQAAREWKVRSPLLEAELAKDEIRVLARGFGLSNWDKPAAACLSSRIPRGVMITREKLTRVEEAEAVLHREGLRQYRVRDHGEIARIEVPPNEWLSLTEPVRRARVSQHLKELGFRFVTVDLEGYRPGGISVV
jgi:pyridinium-3,5-biscarboxylic acid mononucleotide sulfurtransferase